MKRRIQSVVEPAVMRLQAVDALKKPLLHCTYTLTENETITFDVSLDEDSPGIQNAPDYVELGGILTIQQDSVKWSWMIDENEHFHSQGKAPRVFSFPEISYGLIEASQMFAWASEKENDDIWQVDLWFDDSYNRSLMLYNGDSDEFEDIGGNYFITYVIGKSLSYEGKEVFIEFSLNGETIRFDLVKGELQGFDLEKVELTLDEVVQLIELWQHIQEQPHVVQKVVDKSQFPKIASLLSQPGDHVVFGMINGDQISTSIRTDGRTWVVELPHVLKMLELLPKIWIHRLVFQNDSVRVIEGGWNFETDKPMKFIDMKDFVFKGPTSLSPSSFETWKRDEDAYAVSTPENTLSSAFFAQ